MALERPRCLALRRRQAILAAALVAVGPRDPVADRLRRRLELLSQFLRRRPAGGASGSVGSRVAPLTDGAGSARPSCAREFGASLVNLPH